MTGRASLRLLLAAAVVFLAAGSLRAQCSFTGAVHVAWPSVNPVWDFCFRRPSLASAGNGAGLEIADVRYNGTLVIFQAHVPILNVKYVGNPSGCGGSNLCYRDWFDSEYPFQCSPTVSPGVCTGTTTPASSAPIACPGGQACTVCDHPGTDAGTFSGVAVESLADRLKLTSQTEAGWYRYISIWEFFADGTIQPKFVATSIDHTCVAYTHNHHAYYRLDLDVTGSTGNYVDEIPSGGSPQRVTTEQSFSDTSSARSKWRAGKAGSPYVVEIARNAGDGAAGDPLPIPGDFPVFDGWVLAYDSNQISDYSNTFSGCAANIGSWDNDQAVDGADIVLWVRAAGLHEGEKGGMAADCSLVGPTIRVLSIPPPQPLSFHTLAPCRLFDTRQAPGPYGGPALAPGSPRSFGLAGQCGIPPGAKSVSVNLTAVAPGTAGYLVAYPSGGPVPASSVLNFGAGQIRANNAVLPLSAGGAVTLHNGAPGSVHVLMDVTGWFE